ncbi:hypothetical protein KSP39_PZI017862 [Platanthera zijinensis]|uniref:Uncharacterized protein n=1 Tax=Platanthera zijinensis TaxID=2320716 RepID=A0AAP0G069_9ASPA
MLFIAYLKERSFNVSTMNQNNVINASEYQDRSLHYITGHEPTVEDGTTETTAIITDQGTHNSDNNATPTPNETVVAEPSTLISTTIAYGKMIHIYSNIQTTTYCNLIITVLFLICLSKPKK